MEKFPASITFLNEYCHLACDAGGRKLAKELFIQIGDKKVRSSGRKGQFDKAKAWAMDAQ